MNNSRRKFLKVAGLSSFALGSGLATVLSADKACAKTIGTYEKNSNALKAKRWAMVIDTRKLTDVSLMEDIATACHNEHNVPVTSGLKEIKWIWNDTYGHTFPDDASSGAILPDKVKAQKFLLLCNHCSNPPCVRVCPTGATFKMEDGTVAMDYHRCIGCRFCMTGCPYGARSFNFVDPRKTLKAPYPNPKYPTRMLGVVEKCTFCTERLANGLMPSCVEASKGTILFGDLEDPNSTVRKALAENFHIRRKPTYGTEPGVYYII